MDQEKTLAWLKEKTDTAIKEARAGNLLPANYMGAYASTSYYLNNVHRGVTTPLSFAAAFPYLMKEADDLRVSEEQQAALTEQQGAFGQKVTDLEAKIAQLEAALAKLTPAPVASELTPQAPEGDEPPAVTDGEGEPETDAGQEPPAENEKKGKGK